MSVTGLTTARIRQPAPSTRGHIPCFILRYRELVQFFRGSFARRSPAHVLLVLTAGFISAGVRADQLDSVCMCICIMTGDDCAWRCCQCGMCADGSCAPSTKLCSRLLSTIYRFNHQGRSDRVLEISTADENEGISKRCLLYGVKTSMGSNL